MLKILSVFSPLILFVIHTHHTWEIPTERTNKSLRDSNVTKSTRQTLGGNAAGFFFPLTPNTTFQYLSIL